MNNDHKKDLGYYGAATAYVAFGLMMFYGVAEGARRNFGDVGIFSVIAVTAVIIVAWNKDSI